jgi:hypothetical protein
LNALFDTISAGFDNTLSRDGTTPNSLSADIDLNSNDLLNVGSILAQSFKDSAGNSISLADVNALGAIVDDIVAVSDISVYVPTVAGITSEVVAVAGVDAEVSALYNNLTEIQTVALTGNLAAINTVSTNITNVNNVGSFIASVDTVAGLDTEIAAIVAEPLVSDITSVADIAPDVTTVAGISTDVTAVVGISADIQTVATTANLNAVTAVATNITNVNTVSALEDEITAVLTSPLPTNIATVAGVASDVTTVSNISSAVSNVALNSASVVDVSNNMASLLTVAVDSSQINTVANNIDSINTNNDNITAIQNAATNAINAAASADAAAISANLASDSAAASAVSASNSADSYAAIQTIETEITDQVIASAASALAASSSESAAAASAADAAVSASSAAAVVTGGTASLTPAAGLIPLADGTGKIANGWLPNNPAFSGEIAANGGIALGDNDKATFGDGDDLQIYHDGSNSYIEDGGVGNLNVKTNVFRVYNAAGDEISANFVQNGAVTLYHDGAAKLATTSTGIDVSGTATMSGLDISSTGNDSFTQTHTDGNTVIFTQAGTGGDVQWRNANGGALINTAATNRALFDSNGDISFYEDTGTSPKFVWDASAEKLTLSGTGGLTVSKTYGSIVKLESTGTGLGAGTVIGDLQFYGNDASVPGAGIKASITATAVAALGDDSQLMFSTSDGTTNNVNRMLIANNGDVSFYEDTGSSPKFVWSSSAESLGVGNSSPSASYSIDAAKGIRSSGAAPNFTLQETDAANQSWLMASYGGTFAIRDTTVAGTAYPFQIEAATPSNTLYLDSTGNVGIGTSSPTRTLEIASGDTVAQRWSNSSANNYVEMGTTGGSVRFGTSSGNFTVLTGGDSSFAGEAVALEVKSSGRVGIGTSTPTSQLTVGSGGSANPASTVAFHNSAADEYRLKLTSAAFNADGKWLGLGFGYSDNYMKAAIIAEAKDSNARTNLHFCLDGNANNNNAALADSKMTITYGGNVGIGTSSPIYTSATRTTTTINGTASANLSFGVNGTGYGNIYADSASFELGSTTNSNPVKFIIGGTERMRIDASGNLLVGKTSTSISSTGIEAKADGQLWATRDGNPVLSLNRKTSDGSMAVFYKDGTTVGSISTVGSYLGIANGDTGLLFRAPYDDILPYTSTGNTAVDAAIDIGDGGYRFKDLYLSGGVVFGTTGGSVSSKTLDDYEEGTFTITNAGDATGTLDANYTSHYIKVGNLVTVTIAFNPATNFTGNVVDGLPYIVNTPNLGSSYSYASNVLGDISNTATAGVAHGLYRIYFFQNQNLGASLSPQASAGVYRVTFSYKTS